MFRIITHCQACKHHDKRQGLLSKSSNQDTTETNNLECSGTLGLTLPLSLSILRTSVSLLPPLHSISLPSYVSMSVCVCMCVRTHKNIYHLYSAHERKHAILCNICYSGFLSLVYFV